MKNTLFTIAAIIIFATCASDVLSVQNNGIRNPAIEYTTRPPSSYENSAYQNPNSMVTNGNSIVTGNVRQGARFQGEVPYRSTSSFSSANLGTSTLSSFMRDSSGSEDMGRYQNSNTSVSGPYQPYQLQSETVTTMSHNGSGTSNQLNTRIDSQTSAKWSQTGQRVSTLQTPASLQLAETSNDSIEPPASGQIYYPGTSLLQNQYNNSSELRRVSPRTQQNDQMPNTQKFHDSSLDTWRKPSPDGRDSIYETRATNNELDGALQAKINSELLRYNPGYTADRTGMSLRNEYQGQQYQATTQLPYDEPYTAPSIGESRENTTPARDGQTHFVNPRGYEVAATSEFYSPAQNENTAASYPMDATNDFASRSDTVMSSIRRNLQQRPQGGQYNPASKAVQGNQFSTENFNIENVDPEVLRQIKSKLDDLTQSIDARLQSEQYDAGKTSQTHYSSLVSRDSSNENQATSHENKSFPDNKSYMQAKFNDNYLEGEKLLKAGNYYKAAESFATAAIYKPDSSLCFGGQGHALLATGQYISSALFLIRAIELEPEYIQSDIDLAEIVGGDARLENKINELQQLIKNNPAAGLRFLLGYVYYKTDRIVEAKQITNSLYQEMSKSPAALSLQIAVDLKLKNQ